MQRFASRVSLTVLACGLAAALALPGRAPAQQNSGQNKSGQKQSGGQQSGADGRRHSLAYPTGDRETSVIFVETQSPAKARAGEPFRYEIKVTNLSDALALEDVVVTQKGGQDLEIQGLRREGAKDGEQSGSGGPKAKGQQQWTKSGHGARADDGRVRERRGWDGGSEWLIPRLGPGESRTIRVEAVGHREGQASTCLSVKYNPVLCLTTEFVRPDLQLTRKTPEKVDICEPLVFRYTVKNAGSATAKGVTVREELPEGLKTGEGERAVRIDVGDLKPGQSKEFTAKIRPDEGGEYTSRAEAVTANDLRARSREATVRVIQARLDAAIRGPDEGTAGEPLSYTVTVKNEGDAPAKDTQLTLDLGEGSRIVRSTQKGKQDGELAWDLGTLEPGASREVNVAVIAGSPKPVRLTAKATAECARDVEDVLARAEQETAVTAVPALRFSMIDKKDPATTGKDVVYEIAVLNQGSADARDVRITLGLPDELEFRKAEGKTEAEKDGGNVVFGTIDRLGPGQRADWAVHVRASNPGDLIATARLESAYLDQPVIAEESTRVLQSTRQEE